MDDRDDIITKLAAAEAEVQRLQQQLDIAKKTARQFLSDSEWKALQTALHRGGRTQL